MQINVNIDNEIYCFSSLQSAIEQLSLIDSIQNSKYSIIVDNAGLFIGGKYSPWIDVCKILGNIIQLVRESEQDKMVILMGECIDEADIAKHLIAVERHYGSNFAIVEVTGTLFKILTELQRKYNEAKCYAVQ